MDEILFSCVFLRMRKQPGICRAMCIRMIGEGVHGNTGGRGCFSSAGWGYPRHELWISYGGRRGSRHESWFLRTGRKVRAWRMGSALSMAGKMSEALLILLAFWYNADSQNALRYWPYASRELPLLGGDFGLILLFPSSSRSLADVSGHTKSGLQVSHAQKTR